MRIFLSESISGGALAGQPLPATLLREGRAMRDAVAADLARLPGTRVVVTSDIRVPTPSGIESVTVHSPAEEAREFERLCRDCDATLVIAPELDGELSRRVRLASEWSPRLYNCIPSAVDICSDKLELAERLLQAGIPTLPTVRLLDVESADAWDDLTYPVVVKPRCGAGSQSIHRCINANELRARSELFDARYLESEGIVQPFVAGRALSAAACFDPESGRRTGQFPIATQHLSDDGRFRYLGGRIPAPGVDQFACESLLERIAAVLPGLRGYVGFDLLWPTDAPSTPLLVEINPRLTTSYLGYRALADCNLAWSLLGAPAEEVCWRSGGVEFQADGAMTFPSEPTFVAEN